MTIAIGDKIPEAILHSMSGDKMEEVSTTAFFSGKRIVLFGVPGAFTPGCSRVHLPGFIDHAADFQQKGIDGVACMSVNDAFVMEAWSSLQGAGEITMLADGNSSFTQAMGIEMDASNFGMGKRCQRFAMVVQDGVVEKFFLEPSGKITVSAAENVLSEL
ncbi:MAG: peroxiredoxin [Deltaproteobacteria bacterium]|nr:peroxiredoxin [Deltaproteobacteria bacterium]